MVEDDEKSNIWWNFKILDRKSGLILSETVNICLSQREGNSRGKVTSSNGVKDRTKTRKKC